MCLQILAKNLDFFFVVYHLNRHLFPCVSVKSRHCSHIMGARFDNEIHDITFKLHDIFIKNSQQFKLHANQMNTQTKQTYCSSSSRVICYLH